MTELDLDALEADVNRRVPAVDFDDRSILRVPIARVRELEAQRDAALAEHVSELWIDADQFGHAVCDGAGADRGEHDMSKCESRLDGRQCEREAGHRVGTSVWQQPDDVHRSGAVSWTDKAADLESGGSGS